MSVHMGDIEVGRVSGVASRVSTNNSNRFFGGDDPAGKTRPRKLAGNAYAEHSTDHAESDLNLLGKRLNSPNENDKHTRRSYYHKWLPQSLLELVILVFFILISFLVFASNFQLWLATDPCVVAARNMDYVKKRLKEPDHNIEGWEKLPKIIHQQSKNETLSRADYVEWRNKWLKLFPEPEYTHMLWTDDKMLDLVENHYPEFLDVYNNYSFQIQRVDAARYFILHYYGGLYADLDYEPLENFWERLPEDRVALIESPYRYNEKLQNSLMSSPKKDPFWLDTVQFLRKRRKFPVLASTGPQLIDVVVAHSNYSTYKLPCENFQRIPIGERGHSPFPTLLHRELLGRFYFMKSCGNYFDAACQFGKHHNTASYVGITGIVALIWST